MAAKEYEEEELGGQQEQYALSCWVRVNRISIFKSI